MGLAYCCRCGWSITLTRYFVHRLEFLTSGFQCLWVCHPANRHLAGQRPWTVPSLGAGRIRRWVRVKYYPKCVEFMTGILVGTPKVEFQGPHLPFTKEMPFLLNFFHTSYIFVTCISVWGGYRFKKPLRLRRCQELASGDHMWTLACKWDVKPEPILKMVIPTRQG